MSVVPRLRELLDRLGVAYQVLTHSRAYTAQDTAHSMHLPGREIAKVVVIRHGDTLSLAVLPGPARIDLDSLGAALRTRVEPAPESEVAAAFPDCEKGAMPPFGLLYGLKTYVDESLTHDRHVVFNAGTHVEAIRMAFEDYRRIVAPIVLWFAESPARAGG
jgi:Ala-tRNA(Pro) deacylase